MAGLPKATTQHDSRSRALPWIILPRDHSVAAPPLPSWREWHPATLVWWTDLWRSPQAVQWDATGMSLYALALLTDDVFSKRLEMKRASAEIRQHGDRHGLSPKSMLLLRWRLAPETDSAATPVLPPGQSSANSRRVRLRVLSDGSES